MPSIITIKRLFPNMVLTAIVAATLLIIVFSTHALATSKQLKGVTVNNFSNIFGLTAFLNNLYFLGNKNATIKNNEQPLLHPNHFAVLGNSLYFMAEYSTSKVFKTILWKLSAQ